MEKLLCFTACNDSGLFACPSGLGCIDNSSVCDGNVDCVDYGDEIGCGECNGVMELSLKQCSNVKHSTSSMTLIISKCLKQYKVHLKVALMVIKVNNSHTC